MKAAVLGMGGMGGSVVGHLRECPEVDGIVGVDVSETRVAAARERFGIPVSTDLHGVLADDDVTVVFVTASNDAHKELVLAAVAAGKAVMCEKPMANTLDDAREMVEAAEARGAFLQIGFECRYSRLYATVKEWIDGGLLGRVVNTHCTYICSEFHGKQSWRNKLSTGGSMFGEKLSHYVDLPRWWVGDAVDEVVTTCAPNVIPYYEVKDNYHTTYRFAGGAVSHLTFMMAPGATFAGDPLLNVIDQQRGDGHALRYLVVGTAGAAETNVFERTIKRWAFGDSPERFTSTWVEDLTWEARDDSAYFHNTLDQTRDVVRRVATGQPPMTSARDAFDTMRLCFAAERSADSGRPVRPGEL